MSKILVYGSQEFGRVVRDLVGQCGHEFVGYVDDFNRGECILGTYEEVVTQLSPDRYEMVIAVGYKNLAARWQVYEKVKSRGYRVPALIHPRAYVRDSDGVGEGAIVMAGAIVDINVTLAPLAVVWPGVVVNHDSKVGANTFLSPNATICGCVNVGEHCFIGANATVVDHRHVPAGSFVKAGSVFIR